MIIAITIILIVIIICVTFLAYTFMTELADGKVNYYNLNELVRKVEYLIEEVDKLNKSNKLDKTTDKE